MHTKGTKMQYVRPSGTDFLYISHVGAPNDFGRKFGRKNDQNSANFFFRKKEHKKCSETQFHQKRPYITDSSSYLRHGAGTTSSGSGHNNSTFLMLKSGAFES